MNAAVMGTPFDYPLSSRFDENDSIMVFDRVLVPWENVFAYDVWTTTISSCDPGFCPVSCSMVARDLPSNSISSQAA